MKHAKPSSRVIASIRPLGAFELVEAGVAGVGVGVGVTGENGGANEANEAGETIRRRFRAFSTFWRTLLSSRAFLTFFSISGFGFQPSGRALGLT